MGGNIIVDREKTINVIQESRQEIPMPLIGLASKTFYRF